MTTLKKNMLIHVNPTEAYKTFIVNEDLHKIWEMLSRTAVNSLCIETGISRTRYEIIASQQALYMMLYLEMI